MRSCRSVTRMATLPCHQHFAGTDFARFASDCFIRCRAARSMARRNGLSSRRRDERRRRDLLRARQGKPLALAPALLDELADYPACALLWVTFTREDALRHGANVKAIRLDMAASVIATDDAGGFLLFFADDLTEATEQPAMSDELISAAWASTPTRTPAKLIHGLSAIRAT